MVKTETTDVLHCSWKLDRRILVHMQSFSQCIDLSVDVIVTVVHISYT